MLRLLLDEHISPKVAAGCRRRMPGFVVFALSEWKNGKLLGRDHETCLTAASPHGLTLLTYDQKAIRPLLRVWAEENRPHGGVIFVDEKTIPPSEIGGLVLAIVDLAKEAGNWNWAGEVRFLRRS